MYFYILIIMSSCVDLLLVNLHIFSFELFQMVTILLDQAPQK